MAKDENTNEKATKRKPKYKTGAGGNSEYRVTFGTTNADGKRDQKVFRGATRKEAEAKRDEYKRKRKLGIDVDSESLSVSEYCDKWLETKTENMNINRARVKDIKKYIGDMTLISVRRSDIQIMINKYKTTKTNRGTPPGKQSVSSLRYVTHQVFQMAVDDRILELNPVSGISIGSFEKRVISPLSEKEVEHVLNFEHKWQFIFIIFMYTGLRRGELIPLTWGDVDWKNKCISVNKTSNFLPDGSTEVKHNMAKNHYSLRNVYLSSQFMSYLEDLYSDAQLRYKTDDINDRLVCPALSKKKTKKVDKHGEPIYEYIPSTTGKNMFTETQWSNMLDNYHNDYELAFGNPEGYNKNDKRFELTLPLINPHRLRHTFCCSMCRAGVNIEDARRQMGHAEASTTLNIYNFCNEEKITKREIRSKMDKEDSRTPEEKLLDAIFGDGNFGTQILKNTTQIEPTAD